MSIVYANKTLHNRQWASLDPGASCNLSTPGLLVNEAGEESLPPRKEPLSEEQDHITLLLTDNILKIQNKISSAS